MRQSWYYGVRYLYLHTFLATGLKAKLENRAKRISTAVSPAPLADPKEKNSPQNQKVITTLFSLVLDPDPVILWTLLPARIRIRKFFPELRPEPNLLTHKTEQNLCLYFVELSRRLKASGIWMVNGLFRDLKKKIYGPFHPILLTDYLKNLT